MDFIIFKAADPARVAEEIEDTIGLDVTNIVECSAKSGIGIEDILERIVKDVPCPKTVASFEGDGGIDGEVPFKVCATISARPLALTKVLAFLPA